MHRILFVLIFLASVSIGGVKSHEESGEWSCDSNSEIQVQVEFKPGLITLDGHADDWEDIEGSDFSLLPALDPDAENAYKGGKMTVKVRSVSNIYWNDRIIACCATIGELLYFSHCDYGSLQSLHDGRDIFFLLQVDGAYAYSKG